MVLHALEDAPGTMPSLFTTLVALGARSLGTELGWAQGPLQALCTPALGSLCPWQLPLRHCLPRMMWPLTSLLSQAMTLGALLLLCFQRHAPTLLHLEQPYVSMMTVLARALVRGNLVLPGSPWLDPLCPGRNGAALRPLLPQGCVTMLPTLLSLFTPSSVWQSWSVSAPPARQQYPSAPWLLKEQLVRQAGTGTLQSLWHGETA